MCKCDMVFCKGHKCLMNFTTMVSGLYCSKQKAVKYSCSPYLVGAGSMDKANVYTQRQRVFSVDGDCLS